MSFADFKKRMQQQKENSFDKIKSKMSEEKTGGFQPDERYWKFTVDGSGNGQALIRFLPEPDGEDFPYVSWYQHSFKDNDRYYIERSRTSLGKGVPDPVNHQAA